MEGMGRLAALGIAVAFVAPPAAVEARSGDIDRRFGSEGVATAGWAKATGTDLAVAPDGRILVVGKATAEHGWDLAVARFTRKGVLDDRFGAGGRVAIDIGRVDEATHVFAGPGRKTTLVGLGAGRIVAVRLTASGRFDARFGEGGIATVHPYKPSDEFLDVADEAAPAGTGMHISLSDAAMFPDGSLLVSMGRSAYAGLSGAGRSFLVKLDATGAADPTFGPGGSALPVRGWALEALPDGRFILGGTARPSPPVAWHATDPVSDVAHRVVLWRYLPHGVPDPTFGPGGATYLDLNARLSALAAHGGKYYAAGKPPRFGPQGKDWMVTRVDRAGAMDDGFGSNGIVRVPVGWSYGPAEIDVHRNRVWLYGKGGRRVCDRCVARLRMSGKLDRGFGTQGVTSVPGTPPRFTDPVGGMDFWRRHALVATTLSGDAGVVRLKV